MSLSPIATTPAELPALWRRAYRLMDTVSHLITRGEQSYAVFWARVDAYRPARNSGWGHFLHLCLLRVHVNNPQPHHAPDVQGLFALNKAPFAAVIVQQLLHHFRVDSTTGPSGCMTSIAWGVPTLHTRR